MDAWVSNVCKSRRDEKGTGWTPDDQEGDRDSNAWGEQGKSVMLLKEV